MKKYMVSFNGYSDDIVEVLVYEDDVSVFGNEIDPSKRIKINEDLYVYASYEKWGWVIGAAIINEDTDINSRYEITMIQHPSYTHSMKLVIRSDQPIVIEGIYGDKKSEILEVLRNHGIDAPEELVDTLRAKGLLNI